MKLAAVALVGALFAACASQSPAPAPAPAAPTAKVVTLPIAAAPINGKLTPEKLLQLQREGYKIVDRNGEQYFCRTEKKTGSQIARDTVCMTADEVESLRDLTQRRMGEIQRNIPPPQGK